MTTVIAQTATKLPSFAELPPDLKTPEALAAMFENPPVVRMDLSDLQRELREIRGCYEMSFPTLDTNLAFKYGRQSTQWLTRKPNWLDAYRINDPVFLYELTPVVVKEQRHGRPGEFFMHARWLIEVAGEGSQREAAVRNIHAQREMEPRFERAG